MIKIMIDIEMSCRLSTSWSFAISNLQHDLQREGASLVSCLDFSASVFHPTRTRHSRDTSVSACGPRLIHDTFQFLPALQPMVQYKSQTLHISVSCCDLKQREANH